MSPSTNSSSNNLDSMQFMRCAVVGVLIALHLSTDSCCHYIPDSSRPPPARMNTNPDFIQTCGEALTSMVIELCEGEVRSLTEGSSASDGKHQMQITDCCYKGCPYSDLQSYCLNAKSSNSTNGSQEMSASKKMSSGTGKSPRADKGPRRRIAHSGRDRGQPEVRLRGDHKGNRKSGRSRMKKKRTFKRKCAYKSFGHYLLKLGRGAGPQSNLPKVQKVSRSWPPLEVGTVPPETDQYGGAPITP